MAYYFKFGESIPEAVKRIVSEEMQSAAKTLGEAAPAGRDEAIHEARKSIKKTRGLLRLLEPELGRTYRVENKRLRDAGRKLSELRDSAAILEIAGQLAAKHKTGAGARAIGNLERGLKRDKSATEQRLHLADVITQASSTLSDLSKSVGEWPLKSDGFDAIAPGLKRSYRRGRKALQLAQKEPTAVRYHDLRKRVKDHWYHVRLLQSLWTEFLKTREAGLKDLETWLGDDHNLVVLSEKLTQEPRRYGKPDDLKILFPLLDEHGKELREQSIALGKLLYEQKPRDFVRTILRLWDTWQEQPIKAQQAGVRKQISKAAGKSKKAAA